MKTKSKPLATIPGHPKVEIYRAKLRPFESTKYLNVAALKRVKKALIEIGLIEVAGVEVTVGAEVRKGSIVKIRPLACNICAKKTKPRTTARIRKATTKKVMLKALERVRALGHPTVKLPLPITRAREIDIPIGPIIVVISNNDIWSICLEICFQDGQCCLYCLFGRGGRILTGKMCFGPVEPE